ncbi:hypothetical protein Val02_45950 [Virgisporangium aliadipatigenens]|uniref:Glycosyl transferase family 51 domain-containing protein n=1 Tax=Virgisporangium aliadipatigenens TaxID=741659 RepID=A0A8J4DRI6_9ACTN|nr:transglycosylase domain-containing protein [Virgisporangium aliadipatigenens]GIJ47709.1 hypothetical protein Val02_45950 [Virgisporangium aliadipatigenens]
MLPHTRLPFVAVLCVGTFAAVSSLFPWNGHQPADPPSPRASTLYYADGVTAFARVGVVDRTDVPLEEIPTPVRHAFLAAEDRDFYAHRGVSGRGFARTAWAALTGGERNGASTITQQYARNAYLSGERGAGAAVLAVRLERAHTKDEILTRYLNTVYFGRGAHGIAAAARAYFGRPVDRLGPAEGAVLAAVVKDPTGFDPAVAPAAARARWSWIIAAMATLGWADGTPAYPQVRTEPDRAGRLGGSSGAVVDRVERELARRGVSPQRLRTGGLRVVTTLDERVHRAAVRSVEQALAEAPAHLRAALVAVEPSTGAVRAYYGGDRGSGFADDATAVRPAGATCAPVVFADGAPGSGSLAGELGVAPPAAGACPVSAADLASVYATFAAGGTHAERHLVDAVDTAGGAPLYRAEPAARRLLDRAVATAATTRLTREELPDGRPATTTSDAPHPRRDAWQAGYTPDLAAAVWLGHDTEAPHLTTAAPEALWHTFMTAALTGRPQ